MIESVKYFKALADDTRLRLLNLLIHYELNVNEITRALAMGQSRISRHLKILTDSGILSFRRDGLWIFYRAASEGEGTNFINSVKKMLLNDYDLKIDLSRLEWIIEEKSREKTEFFNSIASQWDSMKRNITGDLDITGEISSRIKKSGTIADLGCGTGELLLAMNAASRKVIGVDRSPMMLNEVKSRFSNKNGKIDLRIGAIEHLPMKDGEADAAVINMVLHHLASPYEGITESNRILKKGGSLIIVDLEKHSNEEMRAKFGHRWLGFFSEEMENWLINAGFRINENTRFKGAKKMKINLIHAVREREISNVYQIKTKEMNHEHEDYKRNN